MRMFRFDVFCNAFFKCPRPQRAPLGGPKWSRNGPKSLNALKTNGFLLLLGADMGAQGGSGGLTLSENPCRIP